MLTRQDCTPKHTNFTSAEMLRGIKAWEQENFQMHMHISVDNSCSLQQTELKIDIEIQEGSLYLTTNSVAMETLVMACLTIIV